MKVKIIVDSTADMRPEIAAKVGIVPLSVHFGDRDYISGVNITSQQFYEMLLESDILPTTSQPAPYLFEEEFAKAVSEGYEVICLTCSASSPVPIRVQTLPLRNLTEKYGCWTAIPLPSVWAF